MIMKASTFFLGLAAGSAAAAITVLYSTPKSGGELRTSVKSASVEMKDMFQEVMEKVSELKVSITKLTKEAKKTVPSAVEEFKASIEQWQTATKPNKEQMESELSAIQAAIKELEHTIAAQQK